MKVTFLLAWGDMAQGDVVEIDDTVAAELLCDGVVERYPTPKPETPKLEIRIPETPKRGKK